MLAPAELAGVLATLRLAAPPGLADLLARVRRPVELEADRGIEALVRTAATPALVVRAGYQRPVDLTPVTAWQLLSQLRSGLPVLSTLDPVRRAVGRPLLPRRTA